MTTTAAPHLTPREREVITLVIDGLTAHQIARRLVLSPRTVENHIARVRRRFELPNRAALVAFALDREVVARRQPTAPPAPLPEPAPEPEPVAEQPPDDDELLELELDVSAGETEVVTAVEHPALPLRPLSVLGPAVYRRPPDEFDDADDQKDEPDRPARRASPVAAALAVVVLAVVSGFTLLGDDTPAPPPVSAAAPPLHITPTPSTPDVSTGRGADVAEYAQLRTVAKQAARDAHRRDPTGLRAGCPRL